MKTYFYLLLIIIPLNLSAQLNSGTVQYASESAGVEMSDMSGLNKHIVRMATSIITPSTGNGYSIDISGMSYTTLLGYSITPIKSTTTATSAPKVSVKSESNTAIVVNIIEGNASTVNLLGSLVLLGTSEQFVNTTGLTLRVTVWGY